MRPESVLFRRQSKRAYLPDPIPDDVLERVLESEIVFYDGWRLSV